MKKFFLITLLILSLSSTSYGAVSNDVYVRQDVFDAKMEALFERLHSEMSEIRGDIRTLTERIEGMDSRINAKIDGVDARLGAKIDEVDARLGAKIDEVDARLNAKIDGVDSRLGAKIDGVDKRIDDLRNGLYLWLVAIGLVVSYEPVKKIFQAREERKEKQNKYVTVDEVKRIVTEAIMEAQLGMKTQV